MQEKCPRCKENAREEEFVNNIDNRLNRIIGQLNGIKNMIDENRYCGDVLIQIAAVESALQNVGYMILKDHLDTCVRDKVKDDDPLIIEETLELIRKLK